MPDISKLNVNGESFDISDDVARALLDNKLNNPLQGEIGQYLRITEDGIEGATIPVTSVNGQTGDVEIKIPQSTTYTEGDGISINDNTISVDFTDFATVAKTGNYNDLSNKPVIPTKISDLTNNSDFITKEYVDSLIGDINSVLDEINGEVL